MLTRASYSFQLLSKQCKKKYSDNSYVFLVHNLWDLIANSTTYLTDINKFRSNIIKYIFK